MTNEMRKVFNIITAEDVAANPNLTERTSDASSSTNLNEPLYIERDNWFRISAKFAGRRPRRCPQGAAGSPVHDGREAYY